MTNDVGIGEIEIGEVNETNSIEWMEEAMEEVAEDKYEYTYPFGQRYFPAIEIGKEDIDEQLFEWCIDAWIISEVSKGYFITHSDLDEHFEFIDEYGIETYLERRLEGIGIGYE
jgi:hypothetical protein